MNYIKFLFVLLLFMTSCNKDYNTVGVDLIDNKPFNTDIEEVPVFVKMNKIPPYIANAISTFQLGIYEDNIYGKSKVSFLSQLSFDTPDPVFGIFSPIKFSRIKNNSSNCRSMTIYIFCKGMNNNICSKINRPT